MNEPLLRVEDLSTRFATSAGVVRAVDRVSFEVRAGETLALVGESGSGKTVTALSILRLVQPPGRIIRGRVLFEGRDLLRLSEREMRHVRGKRIAMAFQEPTAALNPVFTCGEQIMEVVRVHDGLGRREARTRAVDMLDRVGIPDAARRADDYPHHLSGGMRQRVMIAMALACRPAVLIADEPTSALDVSVQAQILELLRDLQRELQMAVVLITHDLGVVAEAATRVAVFYAGQIVEASDVASIFRQPLHPYTAGLRACLPTPGVSGGRLYSIRGVVAHLGQLSAGCRFYPRCPASTDGCQQEPALELVEADHWSRCLLAGSIAEGTLDPVRGGAP